MKVNITLNNPILNYMNLGPVPLPNTKFCSLTNLDKYVEAAEANEILAIDIIDYVEQSYIGEALTNWVSKLRIGGTITIGGLDLHEVCRKFARRQIDLADANSLLYGTQENPFMHRKSSLSIDAVVGQLKTFNLYIDSKKFEQNFYYVKARRV